MSARQRGLVRRVSLKCSVVRAFSAVGTLTGIRGWWTPLVSGSAKEDGELTLRFRGLDETIRFRVESFERPRHVQWACLGHDSLDEWKGTRVSFTVGAEGDSESTLELVHDGLVSRLDCYASCRAGWEHFLESLVAWCETGRGTPFGEPERAAPRAKTARRTLPDASDFDAARRLLIQRFARDPRVTPPAATRGRFGDNGLRVDGKVFAMWVRDALVVKLPPAEVDAAVASGHGDRLTMGAKRVMKEWLVVNEPIARWRAYAERALLFVRDEH